MKRTLCLAILLPALLAACGEEASREAGLDDAHVVQVWFSHGERPVAVERTVRAAPLDGALRTLVAGPTRAEREQGLTSWFSPETQAVIRRIQAEDGFVTIDFRDLPELIPNASTSAGSQELLTALDSTVFQFAWVDSVEYRLQGSCDAFWEWLQRGCDVVRRED